MALRNFLRSQALPSRPRARQRPGGGQRADQLRALVWPGATQAAAPPLVCDCGLIRWGNRHLERTSSRCWRRGVSGARAMKSDP